MGSYESWFLNINILQNIENKEKEIAKSIANTYSYIILKFSPAWRGTKTIL